MQLSGGTDVVKETNGDIRSRLHVADSAPIEMLYVLMEY